MAVQAKRSLKVRKTFHEAVSSRVSAKHRSAKMTHDGRKIDKERLRPILDELMERPGTQHLGTQDRLEALACLIGQQAFLINAGQVDDAIEFALPMRSSPFNNLKHRMRIANIHG